MTDTTRIQIDLAPDELQALDRWQAANGVANRSEAARRLIGLGLSMARASSSEADVDAAPD